MYLSSVVLDSCSKILEPAKYEWIIENGLLVATKNFVIPSDLMIKCRCKKECTNNYGSGGHSMHGVLRLYKLKESKDFWNLSG